MRTRRMLALMLGSFIVACCGCGSTRMSAANEDRDLYSKYNLHFISERGKNKASYANYTQGVGHDMLPYNSKIRVEYFGREIGLVDVKTGRRIELEFHPGRMGMSAKQYIDLIMSPTPVSYDTLSAVDQQGIQAGKAIIGMSKQGVLVALGYPAKHRTPSLDANSWIYWKNRIDNYAVEFDGNGKVIRTE